MRLILFFSRGVSLSLWKDSGLLERELKPYKKMLPHLKRVSFLSYGKESEDRILQDTDGFEALSNRRGLPTDLFSILGPFFYRERMRNADIYKTNQINGWWAGGFAKFLYGKPLVLRCGYLLSLDQKRKGYCRLRTSFISFLEKLAFRYSDTSIVTTLEIKKEVIKRYRIPSNKINVIPNPVDIHIFRPIPDIKKVQGRLCFIGRLSPEKNIELLLEALSGVKNASILIIGDGELKSDLKYISVRKGIKARFCGNIPNNDLPELLNTCQAFVLPSKWEGMPKVLIEAMACGLPVVGTNAPGIRDLIEHGRTGILCEPEIENLRNAIMTVLNDFHLRENMGRLARDYVVDHFSLEHCVSKELDLLASIVNQ